MFGLTCDVRLILSAVIAWPSQALELVQRREVFLERGYAYVPMERLVTIIVARFRTQLSKGLLDALHSFPYILADTR